MLLADFSRASSNPNRLTHFCRFLTLGGFQIRTWLFDIFDPEKQQLAAFYETTICACFRRISGIFMDAPAFEILSIFLSSFSNGNILDSKRLAEVLYCFTVSCYRISTPMTPVYLTPLFDAYMTIRQGAHRSPFTLLADLTYTYIVYPFQKEYIPHTSRDASIKLNYGLGRWYGNWGMLMGTFNGSISCCISLVLKSTEV